MTEIYVTKPYLPPMEEYMKYLSKIWDSHILTNMGPLHREFESKLTNYLQVPYCMAFANGHLALETAIQAMHLEGEVITTPYTFASTTHAIVRNGLTPVFCDIKESNYTIDESKIEALITDKTSAIIPVHVYGQICNWREIERIAQKYNLKVIYDAAHAFGEFDSGIGVGNFGDASIFSFHATKPFNSIEGGAIICKDMKYGLEAYQLKNFGFMAEDFVCGIGGNAKLSEFHAAMGLCNLEHMDEIFSRRRELVELYRENLSNVEGISILKKQDNITENYAYFTIRVDEALYGESRDDLKERLENNKIHARRYFYPLTSEFACYKEVFGASFTKTPIAKKVSLEILTLPLYYDMSENDALRVCGVIKGK